MPASISRKPPQNRVALLALPFPALEPEHEILTELQGIWEGCVNQHVNLWSGGGIDATADAVLDCFTEAAVPYSTHLDLHSALRQRFRTDLHRASRH